MPDFSHEAEHGGRVAGVDEVGRGPLAGPVVAAAVIFPAGLTPTLAALLDDSKKLTAEQRNLAYAALFASGLAEIGIGAASVARDLPHQHPPGLPPGDAPRRLPPAVPARPGPGRR